MRAAASAVAQASSAPAEPVPPAVIRNAADFWSVGGEFAKAWLQLDMVVDVLYYDPEWHQLWVRSSGLNTWLDSGDKPLGLESGRRYRLEGKISRALGLVAGQFTATDLGLSPVEPTALVNLRTATNGEIDTRVITVEGAVAAQSEVDPSHQSFQLICNGRSVSAGVRLRGNEPIPQLVGRKVRVTGLSVTKRDPTGRFTVLDLWVPHFSNIEDLGSLGKVSDFEAPLVRAEAWLSSNEKQRVRVVGKIHGMQAGRGLLFRDETGPVLLRTEQSWPDENGKDVEVVGYPVIRDMNYMMEEPIIRPAQSAAVLEDRPVVSLLRMVEQVLELGNLEAARAIPVKLSGVVLWAHPAVSHFYLRDGSAGLRVQQKVGQPVPEVGWTVLVSGVTTQGQFAPMVVGEQWWHLGSVDLPEARSITLEQGLTGVEEAQWVELGGYLKSVTRDGLWSRLQITNSAGEFSAFVPATDKLEELRDSIISVRGVCSAVPNTRRQLVGIELWVPGSSYVRVVDPAPTDAFSLPIRTIASLREFSTSHRANRRARVQGTVLYHNPGRSFMMQEGAEGVVVLSRAEAPLQPGDRVDVVGFPGREASRVVLREASYRRLSAGTEPAPVPLALGHGLVNEEMDARLVRSNGLVLDAAVFPEKWTLLIQAGSAVFEAEGDKRADEQIEPVLPGSTVALTGVYRVQYDEYRTPASFSVQLRSRRDVQVLRAPSWWTVRNALTVVGTMGAALLLGTGWVTVLRRRVRRQTSELRARMEKENRLEARYREIVENASDFIFSLDRTGRFTSFNPAGERIFGYSRAEALGLTIKDLLAEPEKADLPFLKQDGEAGVTVTSQHAFRSRDQRVIWIEISARRTTDANGVPMVLGVGRDVTERKQILEELKRARDAAEANTKAKSAFLANMSHEIRTPMNGVIGMSNLLLDTPLTQVQRDFAETIRNSADALLTVLNDILDFSKIEAGKLHFETLDFNLRETVDETIELLAARAAGKGLELAAFIPTDLPCFLRGDPGRLRQVLLNLLGNAVKFTEKGEVVLRASCEDKDEKHVRLRFEISDTGIGLNAEAQARLFKPFTQADSSTTRKFGGTGLGLAISKQIVDLMGGEIGVRSAPGEGSTFWFVVNLERQPDRPSRAPLAAADVLRGRRTLIVDDNTTNRRIMEHYLEGWSMLTEQVCDGPSALETLRAAAAAKNPFQLVVLDFEMPGMDGVMLAKAIHEDPVLSGLRMVLCTSWDNRFERGELHRIGIVYVMMKPVRQSDLLMALLQAVSEADAAASPDHRLRPQGPREPSRHPQEALEPKNSMRLLVAEDNAVNQRVTLLQLQKLGYRADVAATGIEVLEAMERAPYDVVLMDCQMPEMDGYEATRRIRENPRFGGVRIIAMTANAMQGDRERCLEAGMDDYVSKPTKLSDLQEALVRSVDVV